MNNFYLICKNWFKSLNKIKGAFIAFIVLNFLLGAAFSIFLETNKQINNQIQSLNLNGENYKNQLVYQDVERKIEKENLYHLFCTDYFEINFINYENENTKLAEVNINDELITHRPMLTFGSDNGCFQDIDYTKIINFIKTFSLYLNKDQKKLFFNGLNIKIPKIDEIFDIWKEKLEQKSKILSDVLLPLKINEKSIYYQNSIHGKIMNKYKSTKNKKYLKWAKNLENYFFPKIAEFIYKKIIISLSKFFSQRYIYKTTIHKNLNWHEILQEISQKISSRSEISFKENSINEKLLESLNEENEDILKKIRNKQNLEIIAFKELIEEIKTILKIIKNQKNEENQEKNYFLEKMTENFSSEENSETKKNNFLKILQKSLQRKWNFLIPLLENLKNKLINKEVLTENEKNILKYFEEIKITTFDFLEKNIKIKTFFKLKKYQDLFTKNKNINTIKYQSSFWTDIFSKNELILNNLRNIKKNEKWYLELLKKTEKSINYLEKNIFIDEFEKNKEKIDILINLIIEFYDDYYLPNEFEKNKIKLLIDVTEKKLINQKYFVIKEKIKIIKIALASISERLQQANKIKKQFNINKKFAYEFVYTTPLTNEENQELELKITTKKISDENYNFEENNWKKWKNNIFPVFQQNENVEINLQTFIQVLESNFFTLEKEKIVFINKLFEKTHWTLKEIWSSLEEKNSILRTWKQESNKFNILNYLDIDYWNYEEKIAKIFDNPEQEIIHKIKSVIFLHNALKTFEIISESETIDTIDIQEINDLSLNIEDVTTPINFLNFKEKLLDEEEKFSFPKMIKYLREKDYQNFNNYLPKYEKWAKKIYLFLLKKVNDEIKNKEKIITYENNTRNILLSNIELEEHKETVEENVLTFWKQLITILIEEKIADQENVLQTEINEKIKLSEEKNNYYLIYRKYNFYENDIWNVSKLIKVKNQISDEQKNYHKNLLKLEEKIKLFLNNGFSSKKYFHWYKQTKYIKLFNIFIENQTKIEKYQKQKIIFNYANFLKTNKIEKHLPNFWRGNNDNFEIQENKNWFNYIDIEKSNNKWVWKKSETELFEENIYEKQYKEIIIENEKNTLLLQKIFADLSNLNIDIILGNVVNDPKEEKTIFVMQQNEKIQFQILSGRKAILENEIVISPTTARNNNIKIGDSINFFNIKNFVVTGIANQKEFIFPIFNFDKTIPKKNDSIYYLTQKSYFENFKVSFLLHTTKNFNVIRQSYGIIKNKNNRENNLNENLKNFKILSGKGEENNLTISSIYVKNKKAKYEKIAKSNNFDDLNLKPIENLQTLPLIANFNVLKKHQEYINYSTMFIVILFSLILSAAIFYMINKKIEINRTQLGLLKAIGIKNNKIWIGLLPLSIIISLFIFMGWFVGIFLQLINFTTFETFLNLNFERYNFNLINFLISFAIVMIVSILTVFIYEKTKFKKMSAYVLLKKINTRKRLFFGFNINFLKNNFLIKKNPNLKINFLFFKIFWKKMCFLFVIFMIIIFNILIIAKILTIQKETIYQQYKNVNYAIQFKHQQPTIGIPFSYQRILLNRGVENIKENKLAPLENWQNDIYLKNNEQYELYELKNFIEEVLPTFRPFIGKAVNYNSVMEGIKKVSGKNQETTQEFLCKIFEAEKKNIKKQCIDDIIQNYIPILFEGENSLEMKRHFPLSSNVIKFNEKKDELFTYSDVQMENGKKFNIFGLNENTDVFKFDENFKKQVINPTNNGENGTIEVISNSNFLLKNNLNVGDSFKLQYLKKEMTYSYDNDQIQIINFDDWYYLDEDGVRIPLTDLEENARFYRKWELSERLQNKINENGKIYYKGEPNADGENYYPWINIGQIYLILRNSDNSEQKIIKPFRAIENEIEISPWNEKIGKKISWFARQIRDKKLKIVENWKNFKNQQNQEITFKIVNNIETYFEPRIFLEQGVLNKMIGFNKKKTFANQYKWFNGKFSKSEDFFEAQYIVNLYNDYGYNDFDIFEVLNQKARKIHIKKFQPINFIKDLLNNFSIYFFRVNFFIFVFNFFLIIFVFIWIIKITFHYLRSIILTLKTFGYNLKKMLLQIFQIFFFPFIIAFFVGIILSNIFLEALIKAIATYNFYIFISDQVLISISVFVFLGFILILAIRNFYKKMKKIKLANFFEDE